MISHIFYSHKDEICSSSYLACNAWKQSQAGQDRLLGWYVTESNVQTKYLALKHARNEHRSLELWNFSSSLLCKSLSFLYLQDFWISKIVIPENQCLMDGNSSADCHKNMLSFSHMHTQALGSVLQELRGYSIPLHRAKSGYIWTNKPV